LPNKTFKKDASLSAGGKPVSKVSLLFSRFFGPCIRQAQVLLCRKVSASPTDIPSIRTTVLNVTMLHGLAA
jgi:hypothetical protein